MTLSVQASEFDREWQLYFDRTLSPVELEMFKYYVPKSNSDFKWLDYVIIPFADRTSMIRMRDDEDQWKLYIDRVLTADELERFKKLAPDHLEYHIVNKENGLFSAALVDNAFTLFIDRDDADVSE